MAKKKYIPKSFLVYAHYTADTNEIFYLGKGGRKRAYAHYGRSKWWKAIVAKHGLRVEIVQDGLQEWYAFELEKDMIALHGRKDLGLGPLVNMTDGGDGCSGAITSEELRKSRSDHMFATMSTSEAKARVSKQMLAQNSDPIFVEKRNANLRAMSDDPEIQKKRSYSSSVRIAIPELNMNRLAALAVKNSDKEFLKRRALAAIKVNQKPLLCVETGYVFESARHAEAWLRSTKNPKANNSALSMCANGKLKSAYGHTWRFANQV